MDSDEHEKLYGDFNDAVNMSPATLETFLDTDESRRVGWKGADGAGSGESVGHASGRRIVEIKRKKKAALTGDDYAHMQKVVGYIHRHCAQGGPAEGMEHSDWRYSLMNWGHDPRKS